MNDNQVQTMSIEYTKKTIFNIYIINYNCFTNLKKT